MRFFGYGGFILCVLAVLTEQKPVNKSLRSEPSSTNVLKRKHWRPHFAETRETASEDLYDYNKPAKRRYHFESRVNKPSQLVEMVSYQQERAHQDVDMALPPSANTEMENDLRIRHLMEELVVKSRLVDRENIKAGFKDAELMEIQNRAAPKVDIQAEEQETVEAEEEKNKAVKQADVEKIWNAIASIGATREEVSAETNRNQFEEISNTSNASTLASEAISNSTVSGTPYNAGFSTALSSVETLALPLAEPLKDNKEMIPEEKSAHLAGLSTEAVISQELDATALQQQLGFLQAIAPKIIKDVTENNDTQVTAEHKTVDGFAASKTTAPTSAVISESPTNVTIVSLEAPNDVNFSQVVTPLNLRLQTGASGEKLIANEANDSRFSMSLINITSTTPMNIQEDKSALSDNSTKVSYLVSDWIKANTFHNNIMSTTPANSQEDKSAFSDNSSRVSYLVADWIKAHTFQEPIINNVGNTNTTLQIIHKEKISDKESETANGQKNSDDKFEYQANTTEELINFVPSKKNLATNTSLQPSLQIGDKDTTTEELSMKEISWPSISIDPQQPGGLKHTSISTNNTHAEVTFAESEVLKPITQLSVEVGTEKPIHAEEAQDEETENFENWTEETVENVEYFQDDTSGEALSKELVDVSKEIDSAELDSSENATDQIVIHSGEYMTDSNTREHNDDQISTEIPLETENMAEEDYSELGLDVATQVESAEAMEVKKESKEVDVPTQIIKSEDYTREQSEEEKIYSPFYKMVDKQNITTSVQEDEKDEVKIHNATYQNDDVIIEPNNNLTQISKTRTEKEDALISTELNFYGDKTAESIAVQKIVYARTTVAPTELPLKMKEIPAKHEWPLVEPAAANTNYEAQGNPLKTPILIKDVPYIAPILLSHNSTAVGDHNYMQLPAHGTSNFDTSNFGVDEVHAFDASAVIKHGTLNINPQPINNAEAVPSPISNNVKEFGSTEEKSIDSELPSTSVERLTAESSYEYEELNSLEHLERVIGNYIRHENDNIESFELERRDGGAKINFNDVYGKVGSAQVLAEAVGSMEIQREAETKAATETLSEEPFRTWQEDVNFSVNCHTGTAGALLDEAEVGSAEIENQNETIKEIAKMPTTNSSVQMKHINGQPRPQDKPMHLKDFQTLHNDDIYHEGKTTEMSTIETKLHGMTKKANDKTYDTRRQQIDSADGVDDDDNKGAETKGSGPAEIEHAGVDITPQSNGKDVPSSNDKAPPAGQAEAGAWVDTAEITKTNWWRTLPYAEIRTFLNTIFDSAAHELYEEIARKSKEMQNGHTEVVESPESDEQETASKNAHNYYSFWPFW